MNKKRWFAFALAVIILAISYVVPAYKPETMEMGNVLDNMLPYGPFSKENKLIEDQITAGGADKIAVLELSGAITSAQASSLTVAGYDHAFFLNQLDAIKKDPAVKAILFVVNTPGGGVFESAEIHRKISEIKAEREIPIYVTMQQLAASGGYYVSANADKIYANEETWTGSIGVIMQSFNFTGLFKKYGISVNTITSGENKDMGSSFREWTAEDKQLFQGLVDDAYAKFVDIVAEGRNMDKDTVRKIADGRIYTAKQALDNKLIDAIGNKDDALEALKSEKELTGATVFKYKQLKAPSFIDFLKTSVAKIKGEYDPVLLQMESLLKEYGNNAPRLMYLYGGE